MTSSDTDKKPAKPVDHAVQTLTTELLHRMQKHLVAAILFKQTKSEVRLQNFVLLEK